MVDTALLPAIRQALRHNELGTASPYRLSYARLGRSGASFGVFQGDTNVNPAARATLRQILEGAGFDAASCARVMGAVSQPCPRGNPLSPEDTRAVDNALATPAGCARVDALDDGLLDVLLGLLDTCIAAAARHNRTVDPQALLYIALWINMTGEPDTLDKWLAGSSEAGVAPPEGTTVSVAQITAYLLASSFFRQHPRNFAHLQEAVRDAVPLLPASAANVA